MAAFPGLVCAAITGYASAFISASSFLRPANAADMAASEPGTVLREFCEIGDFFARKRQRRVFERSILTHMSIKKGAANAARAEKADFVKYPQSERKAEARVLFSFSLFIVLPLPALLNFFVDIQHDAYYLCKKNDILLKEQSMPQNRLTVSPEVLHVIKRDLVPLIIEANADSSEALSARPDRYTEGSMGYITWDHTRRAVWEVLRRSPDWRVSNQENDLVLTCLAGAEDFRLRVCRVHPRTRIPTSGKRARENACPGPFLSEQLQSLMYPSREFLVGYDTGILSGVGKITLQVLWSYADSVSSRTLALLYDASVQDSMRASAIREDIPKGKPSRRKERPNPACANGKK